jgi:hypothetical protein
MKRGAAVSAVWTNQAPLRTGVLRYDIMAVPARTELQETTCQ